MWFRLIGMLGTHLTGIHAGYRWSCYWHWDQR